LLKASGPDQLHQSACMENPDVEARSIWCFIVAVFIPRF
jgi:hypothetical protein